jgi:hypothetical protein
MHRAVSPTPVKISREYIGNEPFVMYLGDNLLNKGITQFVREFDRQKPAAQILLTRVPDPQMFGVAQLENGKGRAARRKAEGADRRSRAGRRLHVRPRGVRVGQPESSQASATSWKLPMPSRT